jgi:transcriptional regulator with XRE-family HTH domain
VEGQERLRWPSEGAIAEILGARLKKLRSEQGLDQTTLAAHLGVSKSSIAKYESGIHTPSVTVLVRLARTLGVSVDALLGTAAGGPPPLRDPRLLRCLREISQMEPKTFDYVITVLEALVDAYPMLFKAAAQRTGREGR